MFPHCNRCYRIASLSLSLLCVACINGKIDETFVPLAQVKLPEAKDFSRCQEDLSEQLRALLS